MTGLQVRQPSKSESNISCILCARLPVRVLSFTDHDWASVTRLCGVHYEDLVRRVCNAQLTYEERVAHGVADVESG